MSDVSCFQRAYHHGKAKLEQLEDPAQGHWDQGVAEMSALFWRSRLNLPARLMTHACEGPGHPLLFQDDQDCPCCQPAEAACEMDQYRVPNAASNLSFLLCCHPAWNSEWKDPDEEGVQAF